MALASTEKRNAAAMKIALWPLSCAFRMHPSRRHVTRKIEMIHMLRLYSALVQYLSHECRSTQDAGAQLASAHPSIAGKACISARQGLAPAAGSRRGRGQECRARAADERGDARRLRVAAARDPGRRRRSVSL